MKELESKDNAFAYALVELGLCVVDRFMSLFVYDATMYTEHQNHLGKTTLTNASRNAKFYRRLNEYSHMDQWFACLQGLYDLGPVRDNHYDSSDSKETFEWEDDELPPNGLGDGFSR
ncbi:hypothetical protein QYF36_009495 [Acer negundo]|nr:hypothetical protein QYF36_009495 [Acer negundo]